MRFEMLYINTIQKHFEYMKQLGDQTLQQISEKQLHMRPNDTSVSIAILLQHLHGNMISRFSDFLTTDGEKKTRNRTQEFTAKPQSLGALAAMWEQGWLIVFQALRQLKPEQLMRIVTICGEPHTVVDAINRQLAHYSYHIGQIVYIAKALNGNEWKPLAVRSGSIEADIVEIPQHFSATELLFDV